MRNQGAKIHKQGAKWRSAARDVLKASGTSGAQVAQAVLGHDETGGRVVINRYLSGTRLPKPDFVKRINSAIGELAGSSEITNYLNAIAEQDGLGDAHSDPVEMSAQALAHVGRYFNGSAGRQKLLEALQAVEPKKKQQLHRALADNWRRYLLRNMDGQPRRHILDDVADVLNRFDIDITPMLLDQSILRVARSEDEFVYALRIAMIEARLDIVARNRIEARVVAAHQANVDLEVENAGHIIGSAYESRELIVRAKLIFRLLESLGPSAATKVNAIVSEVYDDATEIHFEHI